MHLVIHPTLDTVFNFSRQSKDFAVYKSTSGNAIHHDDATDTLSSDATNFEGIADQETGTWTPTFNTDGTIGTVIANYSKVGKTVYLTMNAEVGVGTETSFYSVDLTSLPFTAQTSPAPIGSYLLGSTGSVFQGNAIITTIGIVFYKSDASILNKNEITGNTSFTITYQTTD